MMKSSRNRLGGEEVVWEMEQSNYDPLNIRIGTIALTEQKMPTSEEAKQGNSKR